MSKLDPEVKQRWLEALRSGDYVQGSGRLSIENERFCCLGVLCEIAVQDNVVSKSEHTRLTNDYVDVYYDTSDAYLPKDVSAWAFGNYSATYGGDRFTWGKIKDLIPSLSPSFDMDDDAEYTLADLNDAGASFSEIANVIERLY